MIQEFEKEIEKHGGNKIEVGLLTSLGENNID
jgi:hypothetical protein